MEAFSSFCRQPFCACEHTTTTSLRRPRRTTRQRPGWTPTVVSSVDLLRPAPSVGSHGDDTQRWQGGSHVRTTISPRPVLSGHGRKLTRRFVALSCSRTEAKAVATNPRSIPQAPFVDKVEDYVTSRQDVEPTLRRFQEMISWVARVGRALARSLVCFLCRC